VLPHEYEALRKALLNTDEVHLSDEWLLDVELLKYSSCLNGIERFDRNGSTVHLHSNDRIQIEIATNQEAAFIVLWLRSDGVIQPLYPWERVHTNYRSGQGAVPAPPTLVIIPIASSILKMVEMNRFSS